MKSVMISIQPKWCALIANGKKTIEVRKTRPKIEPPFKCYIYCTQPKRKLDLGLCHKGGELLLAPKGVCEEAHGFDFDVLSGKVVGEFACDFILSLHPPLAMKTKGTRLTASELYEYAQGKTLYGWHISNLVIYDKPKEISEFERLRETKFGYEPVKFKRPPQSWCYVESSGGNE